jgi:hypothetical protein
VDVGVIAGGLVLFAPPPQPIMFAPANGSSRNITTVSDRRHLRRDPTRHPQIKPQAHTPVVVVLFHWPRVPSFAAMRGLSVRKAAPLAGAADWQAVPMPIVRFAVLIPLTGNEAME